MNGYLFLLVVGLVSFVIGLAISFQDEIGLWLKRQGF